MRKLTFLVLIQFAISAAAQEDLNLWTKRMPITFSEYPADGETLTNFPVLVILTNTTAGAGFDFSDFLSPPYGDLRFAAADKVTPLDFEVESWNTDGRAHVWVRVPELAHGLEIYALWEKLGVAAPACTTNGAVWSGGYVGVWHMNESPADAAPQIRDSTEFGSHGTCYGSMTASDLVPGMVGGALDFDGANDYVNCGNHARLEPARVTLSAWLKATGNGTHSDGNMAVSKGRLGTSPYMAWSLRHHLTNKKVGALLGLGGSEIIPYSSASVFSTTMPFAHVALTFNGSSYCLFVNGVRDVSVGNSNPINYAQTDRTLHIGHWGFSGWLRQFQGLIDEVRVSEVARSSNWIWACYMNTASNALFNSYGNPEFQGGPRVTNVNSVSENEFMTLNGYLISTGMDANVSAAVFWGTNDAGRNAEGWANTNVIDGIVAEGPLSVDVFPDKVGQLYYFRFFASNSFGQAWANPVHTFRWWAHFQTGTVFSTW